MSVQRQVVTDVNESAVPGQAAQRGAVGPVGAVAPTGTGAVGRPRPAGAVDDGATATATLLTYAAGNPARREEAGLRGALPAPPELGVAVVACMDARINVEALLGLAEGDAHILRNAGGVVTTDIVRSLAVSQNALGTREIILLHHTGCGMEMITDVGFRDQLERDTGVRPEWSVQAFENVEEDVRLSLRILRSSPFLQATTSVRGFVYQVDTGALVEVPL
ncbi:carbonic anhydrase [Frankia sp. AiPa1]|uniref:carbonic anhydrase n=1 Tax=Frankia sp. AiPa1 TaxID=573492 RepID=UPI0027E4F44F|nr:carbonic anhydrase [Frankia sp. AiPa1]